MQMHISFVVSSIKGSLLHCQLTETSLPGDCIYAPASSPKDALRTKSKSYPIHFNRIQRTFYFFSSRPQIKRFDVEKVSIHYI